MLYILSGASRSGKTIVAKEFLKKTGIPYMSVDAIMMGFTNGIPEYGIHDKLWPHEIAERLWPFLQAMCKSMLWTEVDFVLEGEAFLPELVRKLLDEHPDKIRVAFMGYADANSDEKANDIKKFSSGVGDWLVNEPDDYIKNHIENMVVYSVMIREGCARNNLLYFDTSQDFEGTVRRVLDSFKPPAAQ
ncbi:hypothetical protein QTP81_13010 [Alteromonas sp. ASW11-36]|uniref:Adenylate kinase n=1 Tax=Alteromonas arenosi TaxID=3055817 RepID=A0ABT7SZB0_9ALTE|nr:hypothetical protein [Alteromonas sp. ASW11-36]MDM7861515.1 hypothetical protein [Alteromonas sp. ASW11-36]